MRKITLFLILCISCNLNAQENNTASVSETKTPVVKTISGLERGIIENDVAIFKGIPYAAPPVGEFRWRPPQPVKSWSVLSNCRKRCCI